MASATGTVEGLVAGIRAGRRDALARAITMLENGHPDGEAIRARLLDESPGKALRIGVTGPPGCGKSTLVDALALRLVSRGRRVGIVAVDPSSPVTGGAFLGDRIRMGGAAARPEVFIRSMASRGVLGGLAAAATGAADLLAAFGFDTVILETVGVGQSEVAVAGVADTVLVVLAPGAGDGVQAMKAGLMEIGHVFAINKADLEGAEAARGSVEAGIRSRPGGPVPVLLTCALSGAGVDELLSELERC
ncbi:MAG TPA: methylmalonyl Co-A mutase-associated GTPase MeaB [Polyangia bacterium]|nr:methylmalonyl Co-A mutase-associated GTPase MeaB [Polyangia bacterium]